MKKTGATEQALLTNHKPKFNVSCRISEYTTLAMMLIIYCSSFVSFSGCLHIFLQMQLDRIEIEESLRSGWSNMSAPFIYNTLSPPQEQSCP
uniref:Ovule protein n=1 Tax=Mesocestoides corti TaxID=53468 RepID=A0A5K3FZC1_MESCO